MRLGRDFFARSAIDLAPALLGKLLCRKVGDEIIKLPITETECYFGTGDTACHASKGKTARTRVMWERGGVAYVYLCYGMHSMLNIVSGEKDHPEAVLIRGVRGYDGPGKLTKALKITKELNGVDMVESEDIWVEDSQICPKFVCTPRIGIDYASREDRERLWRFLVKDADKQ